jgi:hypothetical protein
LILQVERHLQSGELLTEIVMQFTGDATAFFVLNSKELTGETLKLCRFSLLSRMRLLTLKDLSITRPAEFCFIEYSFSFINRVRGPHSVSEKHRHTFDST